MRFLTSFLLPPVFVSPSSQILCLVEALSLHVLFWLLPCFRLPPHFCMYYQKLNPQSTDKFLNMIKSKSFRFHALISIIQITNLYSYVNGIIRTMVLFVLNVFPGISWPSSAPNPSNRMAQLSCSFLINSSTCQPLQ